jgi:hypothetical protein
VVGIVDRGAYEYKASPAANLLQNPSLESGSGNPPTCWYLGGDGSNSYTWSRTSDAHSGAYAENDLELVERRPQAGQLAGRRQLCTRGDAR